MPENAADNPPNEVKAEPEVKNTDTSTPEQELHELKQALQDLQAGIQQDQTAVDNQKKLEEKLASDVKDLGQALSEIETVVKAYEAAYDNIKTEVETLEDFRKYDFDDIVDQIDSVQSAIDDFVEQVDGEISAMEDSIAGLTQVEELQLKKPSATSVQSAEIDYGNAQSGPNGLEKAQQRFDAWKGIQKRIEDNLKALKDLKKSIEKEEGQKNLKLAYFLFKDFNVLLDHTTSLEVDGSAPVGLEDLTPAVLEDKLGVAWTDLAAKKETLRTAENVLHTRQASLGTTTKGLEEAKKNRKDRIVEAIGLM